MKTYLIVIAAFLVGMGLMLTISLISTQHSKGDCHEAAVAWRHATVYDLRALTSIANYGATEQAAVDIHTATGWVDIAQAARCPGAY